MNILVIAATEAEIALSIKHIASRLRALKPDVFEHNGHYVQFAVTGVGAIATTYHLTTLLFRENYDLVIQAGIAGSFDRTLSLGDVVFVRSDKMGDLGAEDDNTFINIFDLGLMAPNDAPHTHGWLKNPINTEKYNTKLPEVNAITVNTVTGSEATAQNRHTQSNPTLESMEGAALHYVCISRKQPFIQLRAISNYVEKRNRDSWDIPTALNNLANTLEQIILKLID